MLKAIATPKINTNVRIQSSPTIHKGNTNLTVKESILPKINISNIPKISAITPKDNTSIDPSSKISTRVSKINTSVVNSFQIQLKNKIKKTEPISNTAEGIGGGTSNQLLVSSGTSTAIPTPTPQTDNTYDSAVYNQSEYE